MLGWLNMLLGSKYELLSNIATVYNIQPDGVIYFSEDDFNKKMEQDNSYENLLMLVPDGIAQKYDHHYRVDCNIMGYNVCKYFGVISKRS